jgi:hypothetical protein
MSKKRALPVRKEEGLGLGRREVLRGLVAGVGAGVALPGVAGGHPVHHHVASPSAEAAQVKAKAADWKPEFLDAHQFATLTALCARIVPGSDRALADRFVDSLLAVETRDRQRRFLSALGAIEGAALSQFGEPFKSLAESQQVETLTRASSGEPGRKDWIWAPGTPVVRPDSGPETVTLRDHFDHLKGWIVGAYYSSEAGLKELGYTGQMFFPSFPDCTHREHA